MLEDSTSGECVNTYIVCYEIVNPEPGNWKLSSQLFSSEAQTASIIVADISQYGTFSSTTNCEINTLRNGFEVLNTLPDWYQYLLFIAVSSSFGIKGVGQAMKLMGKK